MKHSITRVLTLLLVLVMAVGLLPTVALAGPDEETVYDVYVFVGYPVAGAQPDMQGAVRYDGDPYTVEEVHFFETNSEGVPIGSFLNENDTFVANRNYLCQIFLRPMAGYVFHSELYAEVNNRDNMQVELLGDGTACVSASFVCAPGTVTVTFDANGGPDPAPAPLQVPIGACIWDAIRNFDAVRLPDQPYERFYDWSKDPFATSEGYFDFFTTMNEDLTLYAMWQPTEKSVDFYVSLPEDCLMNDCPGPIIDFPADAHYGGSGDNFYIGLVDGHLHPDLVYTGPLQKGQTYYSRLTVNTNLAASLPQINLHGADFISATRVEGWDSIDVLFSVTIPAGDTLTKADLFINTPRAGQNAFEAHPEVSCLTPGVHAGVQGWFDSPELGTELYEGNLEGGKTYYALVYVGDDAGNYVVSADTLQLNVEGKNVQVVRKVDLSDTMPNYVGAVVAVTIPSAYSFTADVYYGGGKIRSDREPYKWVTTMDFSGCET
ncbi:MAG: InlB B-repeat-containing protein, partial [Clostridia bacterium]|nr:InlB B-repeat-containing protein [Clostridia bacterium]